MVLASLGWTCWWIFLFAERFAPHVSSAFWVLTSLSTLFAAPGLVFALWSVRARKAWLFFTAIAVAANAGLLAMPWIARHFLARGG